MLDNWKAGRARRRTSQLIDFMVAFFYDEENKELVEISDGIKIESEDEKTGEFEVVMDPMPEEPGHYIVCRFF